MSSLLAGPPRRSQWLVVSVNRFRAVTAAAACGTGTAAPGNWGPRAATRATLRAAARAEEIMMQTAGNKTRTGPPNQRSNGCDSCGGLIVAQADAKLLGHHHINCDSANWVKDHHKARFINQSSPYNVTRRHSMRHARTVTKRPICASR